MQPPNPDDQRAAPRAPVRLRVEYQKMNSFFADYTKNISKGGTFIKTKQPLPIGTRCMFAMSVPALSEPLLLQGEVAWILSPEAALEQKTDPGMGVQFRFDSGGREEFEELVERMMAESLGADVAQELIKRR
jgi:type IV pilus assembly protein PilZ